MSNSVPGQVYLTTTVQCFDNLNTSNICLLKRERIGDMNGPRLAAAYMHGDLFLQPRPKLLAKRYRLVAFRCVPMGSGIVQSLWQPLDRCLRRAG